MGSAPGTLWRAAELAGVKESAAAPAERAGLITLKPDLRFRHPLIRSAAYGTASDQEKRQAHSVLAAAARALGDRQAAAWHLAAATDAPDETVAAELEAAAQSAHDRGSPLNESAFLGRAAELSPPGPRAVKRRLRAAEAALFGGAPLRAESLASQLPPDAPPADRAQAEHLRVQARLATGRGVAEAPALLLDAALSCLKEAPALAREILLEAVTATFSASQLMTTITPAELGRPHPDRPRRRPGSRARARRAPADRPGNLAERPLPDRRPAAPRGHRRAGCRARPARASSGLAAGRHLRRDRDLGGPVRARMAGPLRGPGTPDRSDAPADLVPDRRLDLQRGPRPAGPGRPADRRGPGASPRPGLDRRPAGQLFRGARPRLPRRQEGAAPRLRERAGRRGHARQRRHDPGRVRGRDHPAPRLRRISRGLRGGHRDAPAGHDRPDRRGAPRHRRSRPPLGPRGRSRSRPYRPRALRHRQRHRLGPGPARPFRRPAGPSGRSRRALREGHRPPRPHDRYRGPGPRPPALRRMAAPPPAPVRRQAPSGRGTHASSPRWAPPRSPNEPRPNSRPRA